ncbi:MAG: hypothetical protein ACRED4_06765 [Brevundimonas sp.]
MKIKMIALSCVALAVAGCETTTSYPYQPSTQNVMAFQSALAPSNTKVQLGAFTRDPGINTTPACRMMGPIDVAPGKSMEVYIRDAMQAELFQAGVLSSTTGSSISGRIDAVDLNTLGTGSWSLTMTLTSSADPTGYQVATVFPFSSSFSAVSACKNASAAFGPAVNDLISKAVSNPGFNRLAGAR